jgi:hypothetical protein
MVQPLGMGEQLTLTKSGACIPKYRLTQDFTFSLTEAKVSVNDRINMDAYYSMSSLVGFASNAEISMTQVLL